MLTRPISALLLAAFLTLLAPAELMAAPDPCVIKALDSVAGLGSQFTMTSCEPSTEMTLAIRGPSGDGYTQTMTTDGSGNATTLIPSKVTTIAGLYHASIGERPTTFTVIADRPDPAHSRIQASPESVSAGGSETVTVSAALSDTYGNPVSGRLIGLISSRTSDVIPKAGTTDDDGVVSWSARLPEAGTARLVAYDVVSGEQLKMSTEVKVGTNAAFQAAGEATYRTSLTGYERGGELEADITPVLVDGFELSLPNNALAVPANELFSLTIRAMHQGTIVRSYIGTLVVESSDPNAELPKKGEDPRSPSTGRVDVRNVDQGERKVPLSFLFKARGQQSITVHDRLDPEVRGTITLTVDGGAASSAGDALTIVDPKDGQSVKTLRVQGRGPTLIDILVTAGKEEVIGSIESDGVFRIDVPLNLSDKQVTIYVQSEDGALKAKPVTVYIDNDAPHIASVDIVPSEGKTGQKATVTVKSEPGLTSVMANVDGKDTVLTATGSGLYTGSITAPPKAGTYDVKIEARDSVENIGSLLVKWKVVPKVVPVVQGLKAQSLAGKVKLSWDAVKDYEIAEYKIYVARESEPQNILYALPTKKPVTSAVLEGLPVGIPYLFALTAIGTDNAEGEKSAAVAATPLGIALKATPGRQHVVLEWTLPERLPFSQFILEYGTEVGQYTEKRTVLGQATSTTVRDLIGGLSYEFRLTPVAVTGKKLTEMASVVRATPVNGAFALYSDPVPDGAFENLHGGAPSETYKPVPELNRVPRVTGSGIGTTSLIAALFVALMIGMYVRSVRREGRLVNAFLSEMQSRYDS